jgi:hypothetical protein
MKGALLGIALLAAGAGCGALVDVSSGAPDAQANDSGALDASSGDSRPHDGAPEVSAASDRNSGDIVKSCGS